MKNLMTLTPAKLAPMVAGILESESFKQRMAQALKEKILQGQLDKCLAGKSPEERAAIMKVIESPEFKQRLSIQ